MVCQNCGRETRNSPNYKGSPKKPIDYCSVCIKEADKERKLKDKEVSADSSHK